MNNLKSYSEYNNLNESSSSSSSSSLIEEIEMNGKMLSDYDVDEYDEIENAGHVEIYLYNAKKYSIVTWSPESEKGHIGKEIINVVEL